ncbi:MAG: cytochrome C, partial [Nitrospirota bacterium]|nr:cytochrome C [Nitrospirota bacterium]
PAFVYPAPVAVADPYNWTETNTNHPAYGSGMSEWCANCHADVQNSGNKHPSGSNARLGSRIAANYNSYVKTGYITGSRSAAYLSLVPFELGTEDRSLLDPKSASGPAVGGKANVMCLTCHRAHASAFETIGRWDMHTTFIRDSHPKYGDSGVTGNDVLNSYYGRNMSAEYGDYQRQFCNKCHIQD